MRILFYHSGCDLYGASRSLLRLTSRLVQDGHAVKVMLPMDGPLLGAFSSEGVDAEVSRPFPLIERSVFKSPVGLLRFAATVPCATVLACRLLRRFQPDVVHSNTSVIVVPALAARIMRVRHVWHLRETYAEFGLFWRVYRRFMQWGADRIVAVSSPIAEQLPARMGCAVHVIHNGLPQAEAESVSSERTDAFRARYDLGSARLVGLIGRIKFIRKGQEFLVDAAALLKPQFPDVRFVVVGSPFPGNEAHLERLRARIRERDVEDVVVCTGDVDDIKAVYASLAVSVLASALPEPFGGVVIESMAYGIPVVGTAIGGTTEQVVDGETGILVPPRDVQALAAAIARLLDAPALCAQMGQAGRQRFLDRFEFERFYGSITTLYDEVISR
ncbi:MAG: glycosyltransferase family 4 protein [Verrucomicrobia bacterium]|jgi:glycosyltransferase involved in cell wall biosynthesis|nr:glycosyltransferase family 4 protein [Verrucomicrobiota bacterium]